MVCRSCHAELAENDAFCPECGAAAAPEAPAEPVPEHFENGITVFDGCMAWDAETAALRYPAVFTAANWTIGLLGGITVLLLLLLAGAAAAAIAAGVSLGIWLLTAGSLLLVRGGRFCGHFALEKEAVTVCEEVRPPKNPLLLVLYVLFRLAALIVRLAWLFSGEDTMYDMTGGSSAVQRKCKYEKICAVVPSADRTEIILQKRIGNMKLIVTPEQYEMILAEIERHRKE